ncbi:MAG: uroporphyrinogen decarboxylase family protein [Planctomycetota bacterium]
MISQEIVSRAIHYEGPERLPVLMGSLGVSDVDGIAVQPAPGWEPVEDGADEWNCVWSQTEQHNMGQVTGHPLEDLSDLDDYEPPSFHHDERYDGCEEKLDRIEEEGKYARCGIFMVMFERMHSLHGFENTLMDLYSAPERLEELADMIADTHVSLVEEVSRRFPGRIDGWNMSDDWGTQQSSFISYEKWMEFFYPRYKRIFDAMHEAGCDVWVHSCGKINDIIQVYIRAGVDVVNLQQPRVLGIQEIAERYRGDIAFESLSDIQSTLPTGDPEKIEADAEALMTHWAGPDGGFLFSGYGDDEAIGVDDEKVKPMMYSAFSRYSEQVYGQPLPPIE